MTEKSKNAGSPGKPDKVLNRGRIKEAQNKRRKYVINRTIGGMNKKDAALAAGFSSSMAWNAGAKIETPEVLGAIESFEKALVVGIPTATLVQKFAEGLEATVVKTAQRDGDITDVREFPDYPTRLQYLEQIVLISKRYQPKSTTEHTGKDGGPIELMALSYEELQQRKQWLERELGISQPDNDLGGTLPPPQGGQKTH